MRAYDDLSPRTGAGTGKAEAWLRPVRLNSSDCCLTSRDYTLLEAILYQLTEERTAVEPLLPRLIRAKLADARVVLSADVEPDVATGNSRIAFSVDGGPRITRVLTHWEEGHRASDVLPVRGLLGATLLGMRAGQQAAVRRHGAAWGSVELQQVLFQPEAARQGRSREEVGNG